MRWSILFYILSLLLLTIYSYTQVDLNLTLSGNIVYQNIQKLLTYIGYFDRPLSTIIYITILTFLSINYFVFLRLIPQKQLTQSTVIKLIGITAVILFFSYPAFSHDIFNYIFDARIIGNYGLNPYEYKALDFPNDPWIRFMHWTHRTYPYGPLWVILTLPFYFLGLGKFISTLFSFKLLFVLSYLGSILFIYKIMSMSQKERALHSIVWFGLNPIILIESLVSPHNEIVMLFITLLSICALLNKRFLPSIILMLLSGAIKFISWVYIPILFFIRKDNQFEKYIKILIALTLLLFIPVVFARELYPWYIIPFIGLGALTTKTRFVKEILIGFSIGSLLQYAPYLYTGEYSQLTRIWQIILLLLGTSLVSFLSYFVFKMTNGNIVSNADSHKKTSQRI